MSSMPRIGEEFAGYRLSGVLGRGGMSVVYQAEHPRLGAAIALKVLAAELTESDVFRIRFLQESRTAASLNHPNVIPIYDSGPCGDLLYIAMRYVSGADLRAVLRAHDRIPPAQAMLLIGQTARALDAAHHIRLVHRDVKPANILIEHAGEGEPDHVYLADFGISKHSLSQSGLTSTGQFIGTIDYIAPEQVRGQRVDGRSDIYSLGCVLYQCLTGRVPFLKDIDAAVIWAHVEEQPVPPSSLNPELPRAIDDVLMKAMAKDPADRYSTCREFVRDAQQALASRLRLAEMREDTLVAPRTVLSEAVQRTALSEAAQRPAAAPAQPSDLTRASPASDHPASDPSSTASSTGDRSDQRSPPHAVPWESRPPTTDAQPERRPPDAGASAERPASPAQGRSRFPRRHLAVATVLLLVIAGAVAAIIVAVPSSPTRAPANGSAAVSPSRFAASARPVPTNRVHGSGTAAVRLSGNVATVTVDAKGLINGAHLMHIHGMGEGMCPPASAAKAYKGHRFVSTTGGHKYYGDVVTSLTVSGSTSPSSYLAFARYPAGSTIRYRRTIRLPGSVAALIRSGNAVVVVHGINYDGSGVYDDYLGRSELNSALTAESTAPALCGTLRRTKVSAVPFGAVMAAGRPAKLVQETVYTASLRVHTPSAGMAAAMASGCGMSMDDRPQRCAASMSGGRGRGARSRACRCSGTIATAR